MVEVDDKYKKKVIWKVVDDHVVEEGFEHEEIGLRGFIFIYSMKRGRDVLGGM